MPPTVLVPAAAKPTTRSRPESRRAGPSGAADASSATPVRRVDSVDFVRGLVMVVMVLDHVRAYATAVRFDPTDVALTTVPLFLTRWITHYCAPTFVFLAGVGAWSAATRRTPAALSRFLLTRGLWFILLEATVVSLGWYFRFDWSLGVIGQVIWAIGASMVVLAAVSRLPRAAVGAIAVAIVAGHNLLDGVRPETFGAFAPLWRLLHVPGPLEVAPMLVMYPMLPWFGVMALGWAAGPLVLSREPGRARRLIVAGAVATLAFVALRAVNGYGDPAPWTPQATAAGTAMSFLNVTKYPPSLAYVLMTLGPALVLLGLAERMRGPVAAALVTFGRVPLFFYVAHLYLAHALGVALAVATGHGAAALLDVFVHLPAGYGVGLPGVYAAWLAVTLALLPACAWYARVKAGRREWWWSYL